MDAHALWKSKQLLAVVGFKLSQVALGTRMWFLSLRSIASGLEKPKGALVQSRIFLYVTFFFNTVISPMNILSQSTGSFVAVCASL